MAEKPNSRPTRPPNQLEPVDTAKHGLTTVRRWLILLTVVGIVPWIVVGLYFRPAESAERADAAPDPAVLALKAGPWGRMSAIPLVVAPPVEYVSTAESSVDWFLPGVTPDDAAPFLAMYGLTPDQIGQLRPTIRVRPEIKGVSVTPTLSLVRSLTPEIRARLYSQLAKVPMNRPQFSPFQYPATTPEGWLWGHMISPATRALVEPLLYQRSKSLFFSDLELLRSEMDASEFLRLTRLLNRRPTYMLKLSVNPQEVDSLVEYWGIGGRRTDIRAVLESISSLHPEERLDIVHVLPTLARARLYRFPRVTAADFERPIIANCLWTALNFFSQTPDDKYLDVKYALDVLKNDYYIVENNFRLGDIVAFVAENETIFHAAVYLADDFVFTKNGTTPMAPWAIMRLDEVRETYNIRSAKPNLIVHRYEGH